MATLDPQCMAIDARLICRRRQIALHRACRALSLGCAIAWVALHTAGCSPAGLAIGAAATTGVAAAQERPIDEAVSDTAIRLELNGRFLNEDVAGLYRATTFDVVEGRVLLTGTVADLATRDKATALAWQSKGVRAVINELIVGDATLIDSARDRWITTQLRGKLLGDGAIYDINYAISTNDGVIYLIGIAQDNAERRRAVAHAKTIAHVRKVVSHVILRDDPERPQ